MNPHRLLSSGLEPLTKDPPALGDHGIHGDTQRARETLQVEAPPGVQRGLSQELATSDGNRHPSDLTQVCI